MKFTNKKSNTSIEFKVEFDKDDLESARLKALERLARNIKISGFRNGKAPANVVEQHVDPNELATQTLDVVIRKALPEIFDKSEVMPISIPHVDVVKYVPGEMAEVTITSDIMPEVKLGDYKNLKVSYEAKEIKDEDVEDVLQRIAENSAESCVVKRKAKDGDEVIVDFKGLKDGVAFDGGTGKDVKIRLGSGQFIPGFEKGIEGHESGDKFNLDITFPKNYGVEELAGQPVVFEMLVKQVNEIKVPEINDELAQKIGAFPTIKELREDIRKNLEARENHDADERYKDDLLNALVDCSKTEAPKGLIEEQSAHIKEDMIRNLKSRGLTIEDYLEKNKQKEEDWSREVAGAAERRVISSIIVQALSDELGISIDEAAVEQQVAELREVYKKDEEAVKQLDDPQTKVGIRNRMRVEATMEELAKLNRANAKPAKAKKTEAKAKKSSK